MCDAYFYFTRISHLSPWEKKKFPEPNTSPPFINPSVTLGHYVGYVLILDVFMKLVETENDE